jgi:hypothetical protein
MVGEMWEMEARETFMLLHHESTWPSDVVQFIDRHCDLFDDWEGPTAEARIRDNGLGDHSCGHRFSARQYDEAVFALRRMLQPHTLESGYHCARLTDAEIDSILRNGMQLQNSTSLRRRVEVLQAAGLVDDASAAEFLKLNSADDTNRAGMIWFCFFPPRIAGESGIESLLRHWGGEALYRWHRKGALLQRIGTPCIVVADVPIADLNENSSLSTRLVRRYFQNRGRDIREEVDHEGYTRSPLSAEAIRSIVRFPDPEFLRLTGCDTWREGL